MTTIQSYLKDSDQKLHSYMSSSTANGTSIGVKLVRGAYMREEIEKAMNNNVSSPIHESKECTNYAYNMNLENLLEKFKPGDNLCVATHNRGSAEFAKDKLSQKRIDRKRGGVTFGQLLGMKSMMSSSLASSHYAVQKYIPFGPVEKLIPYLARRAVEQSEVVNDIYEQVQQIQEELTIRFEKDT